MNRPDCPVCRLRIEELRELRREMRRLEDGIKSAERELAKARRVIDLQNQVCELVGVRITPAGDFDRRPPH